MGAPFSIRSKDHLFRGAAAGLLAAALFGASTPLAKMLLADVTPHLLAGLLYVGSGILLGTSTLVLRRGKRPALGRRDMGALGAAVLCGGVLGPVLLLVGLGRTSASTASLLLNLEGVFTALLAWFAFGEAFNRRIGAGMALIAAGGVCLSWEGAPGLDAILGPLCIVAACAAWALDNNFTRRISACDAFQIASVKGLVAGSVNTLLAVLLGSALPGFSVVISAATLGVMSYGLSLVLFVVALRNVGSARTGAYFSTAPFIGAALSLALGDRVGPGFYLAAMLMGLGVWLHLTEEVAAG